jgi:hypothetical protein
MFQYGIGFNATNQRKYYCKGKEERKALQEFIYCIDETLLKVGNQYVGFGLLLLSL